MDELKKVYEKGFTAAEVDGAKKALLDARMVGRSTDGALLNLMVSHEQLNRPLKWDADLEAKIQALTADQVNAAFRKHIDPNGVSIVKAGDFKAAGVYKYERRREARGAMARGATRARRDGASIPLCSFRL